MSGQNQPLKERVEIVQEARDRIIGNKRIQERVEITKRLIPVKRCVLERRNWPKYGEVKGVPRGEHRQGDYTVGQELKIETLDSVQTEEINIVVDIKNKMNTAQLQKKIQQQKMDKLKEQQSNQAAGSIDDQVFNPPPIDRNLGKPTVSKLSQMADTGRAERQQFTLQIKNIVTFPKCKSERAAKEEFEEYLTYFLGSSIRYRIRYMNHRVTGNLQDYVFIEFQSKQEASQALTIIRNRSFGPIMLDVDWAQDRSKK